MKLLLFLTVIIGRACASYDCLCNYDIEKSVYLAQSVTSTELGYLYEFDCKQMLNTQQLLDGWKSVAFEHQTGYVKMDTNAVTQVCNGDPPLDDMVTTAQPVNSNHITSTTPQEQTTTTITTTKVVPSLKHTTAKAMTTKMSTMAQSSDTTIQTKSSSSVTSPTTTPKEQTSSTTTTTKVVPTFKLTTVNAMTTIAPSSAMTSQEQTTTATSTTKINPTTKPTTVKAMTTTDTPVAPSSATTPQEQTTTATSTTKINPTTKLTTVKAMTTADTTMAPSSATTISTLATPMATTSASVLPNNSKHICPQSVYNSTMSDNATLIINQVEKKCYEFVQSRQTWSHAEANCQKNGGHLVTVRNVNENNELYEYVKAYGHSTWLGLNDNNQEDQFIWASGEISPYTNWRSGHHNIFTHGSEDCVCMLASTGHWEDLGCYTSYAYICEYASIPDVSGNSATQTPITTDGNTQLCPFSDVLAARTDPAIMLGQYGDSCYVLTNGSRETWTSAEYKCKRNGGHLAHIRNAEEQNFILSFLTRHSSLLGTWIGLSDTKHEGQFQWSDGEAVTYTNWITGFNGTHHSSEDCVVLLPNQTGKWDEVYCSSHGSFFSSQTERHQIMCQYRTQNHASSILIG